jgi:hypothetical protein
VTFNKRRIGTAFLVAAITRKGKPLLRTFVKRVARGLRDALHVKDREINPLLAGRAGDLARPQIFRWRVMSEDGCRIWPYSQVPSDELLGSPILGDCCVSKTLVLRTE